MNDIKPVLAERPPPPSGPTARPPVRRASTGEAMHMRATIGIFRRHILAFLFVATLVPGCAWVALQRIAPQYTATGSLIYDPAEYKSRELQSLVRSGPVTDSVMASQAEILRSLKITERAARRGNLYENSEFNAALRPQSRLKQTFAWIKTRLGIDSGDTDDDHVFGPMPDESRDTTLMAVRDALRAAPVRGSQVIDVTFTASDPLVAAATVNNVMDLYVKDQFAAKAATVHRASDWLARRAAALREEVRKAEDRIAAYRAGNNFAQGMHAGLDAEKITHLNEDLGKAQGDLAAADARLDKARGRAGAEAQAAIASSVAALRVNLDQITAQYQSLTGRVGAKHPEAEGARRQIEEARRAVTAEVARVVAATDHDRRAAFERVKTLERNLRNAQIEADQEAKARIPLNAMERDAEAARAELKAMLERIQQTAQQQAVEISEAREVSLALPPMYPSWPKPVPMMAAALAAGIALGLMLVYVLHLSDTTFHGGEDARAVTNLPCFALIPELTRRELRTVPIQDMTARRPLTAFSEQIRAVRAGLYLGSERPRVVAITAARPAEGKSLLALSLARSAGLSGEKVLLIDCDLRRPALARWLGADSSAGLVELLRGKAEMQDVLHADPVGGMHFIPAGRPSGDTFGLFMGPDMARLLNEARREYSLILLDSPPIQAITEARVLAAVADATILCIRWRSTPRAVVVHSLELLEDANATVAGTVMTRVDPRVHVRSGYADAEVYHSRYKAYQTG